MSTTPESEATREAVRQRYAGIARETMAETAEASGASCCAPSCCGAESPRCHDLATSIGYTRRRAEHAPRGGQHGPLLRQPHGDGLAATR